MTRRVLWLSLILGAMGVHCQHSLYPEGSSDEGRKVLSLYDDLKNPNDRRKMRRVMLKNGLEALLVHDPSLNKSSAALDVAVGSLADPPEHQGLAHFLEHMLFLGTEKYPDVDEYSSYIAKYQGMNNAYTAAEDTNYLLEISHPGLEGALDRFAQFFIAPRLDAEYIERERNAVHSEHQKNLESDAWRQEMLWRLSHAPSHPRHSFSTGDLKSLAKANRDVLLKFYREHYSANLMKLVVQSSHSLEDLETWVRDKFSPIANTERQRLSYPYPGIPPAELPMLVRMEPVKDLSKLVFGFELPSQQAGWEDKSAALLCSVLGYEGAGSLLSQLKRENLAVGLSAGFHDSSYATELHIEVELTDTGVAQWQQVGDHVFATLRLLAKEAVPETFFADRKKMAEHNFRYREFQEDAFITAQIASEMQHHPSLELEKRTRLYHRLNSSHIRELANMLIPQRAVVFLIHPGVGGTETEPHYGTRYRRQPLEAAVQQQWLAAPLAAEIRLPGKNDLVPERLEAAKPRAGKPELLLTSPDTEVWFQFDDRFEVPKAYVELRLWTPATGANPSAAAQAMLYAAVVNESLSEMSYEASLAGLHFGVQTEERGLVIQLGGYAPKLPALLASLLPRLRQPHVSRSQFEALRAQLVRDLANTALDDPYRAVMYDLKTLLRADKIHRSQIFDADRGIDLVSQLTLDQVQAYAAGALLERVSIAGLIYGNVDAAAFGDVLREAHTRMGAGRMALAAAPHSAYQGFASGQHFGLNVAGKTPNHCFGEMLNLGGKNPEVLARLNVGNSLLRTSFFSSLRTEQQLGYIVHHGLSVTAQTMGLLFLIQSSEYEPVEIRRRIEAWKAGAVAELAATSETDFALAQRATADELREPLKTMGEQHDRLVYEALDLNQRFGFNEEVAAAVDRLTLSDVVALYKDAYASATPSLAVFHFKSGVSGDLSGLPYSPVKISQSLITGQPALVGR